MDNRPPSSRPMSIRVNNDSSASTASSGRVGTASRLSASRSMISTAATNRLGTSKNFGFTQKVIYFSNFIIITINYHFRYFSKGLGERPLTQQGLSGFTTSQGRLGTASGMRQVKDKRYWMAMLQAKTQEIFQETEKLNKERKNLDRETSAKKLYEKKVKEQVKELSGEFSILNLIHKLMCYVLCLIRTSINIGGYESRIG
jgi:hypothetical protein